MVHKAMNISDFYFPITPSVTRKQLLAFTALTPTLFLIVGQEESQAGITEPCLLQGWVRGKVPENHHVIMVS
jgi:hypothetical protein